MTEEQNRVRDSDLTGGVFSWDSNILFLYFPFYNRTLLTATETHTDK